MKVFILLVFLSVAASAEKITIIVRPNGASCNHVAIHGANDGRFLAQMTIADISEIVRNSERPLFVQIKTYIKKSGLTNLAQIKTMLEAEEFDLD